MIDAISQFHDAIRAAGLEPPKVIEPGKWHRFPGVGKSTSNTAGWCRLFADGLGGSFGDFASDFTEGWQAKRAKPFSQSERAAFRRDVAETQKRADAERQKQNAEAAEKAVRTWSTATPAVDHPYLKDKGVKPHGILEHKGELVVPMRNAEGEILNYQTISGSGEKRYLKGGKKSGLYHLIGNIKERVYIVEGFATGATVHELTGDAVVVAFDTSGLKPALAELRKVYAGLVVFAADNDRMKTNAGKIGAEKAATGDPMCSVIVAEFPDDEGTDFNDLAAVNLVEAKRQLRAGQYDFTYQTLEDCLSKFADGDKADKETAFKDAVEYAKSMPTVAQAAAIKALKSASGVLLPDIRRAMAGLKAEKIADLTHGQMAEEFLKKALQKGQTVGCYGKAWLFDGTAVWSEMPLSMIGQEIGDTYVNEDLCKRGSDYRQIAGLFYTRAADEDFFIDAPSGVVCAVGFYSVAGERVVLTSHKAENRARFKLAFNPEPGKDPDRFLKVLRDAFGDHDSEGQIRMLQQYFGLAVMGLQYQTQTAVLLYGAGGSGKGLVQAVLKALLPDAAVSTVSPHDFDNEYSRAVIAGKRLNLCSELDHEKPIPAAQFKAMTGGDPQNGREPYGMPFTFRPTCGVWVNSNFYPVTKDRSDGFWRRWAIVYFANGRSAEERNPNLEAEILEHEMGAVLAWAIQGVEDYLTNGSKVLMSQEHARQMSVWKSEANSVTGWLGDEDGNRLVFAEAVSIRVADAYTLYKDWCQEVGKRHYAKAHFVNAMADEGFPQTKRSIMIFAGIGKEYVGARF